MKPAIQGESVMPIYEFSCGECNNRFEELVFTHCEG